MLKNIQRINILVCLEFLGIVSKSKLIFIEFKLVAYIGIHILTVTYQNLVTAFLQIMQER